MAKNEIDLEDDKEPNFIIISKPGVNTTKNNRSFLTYKQGDYSLKININNSLDDKLDKQRILKTISNLKNQIIKQKIKNKNRLTKYSKIGINENQKDLNSLIQEKNNNMENRVTNKEDIKNMNNHEDTNINNKNNKEFSSIIIDNENKLSENDVDKDNIKEIEENFVCSINKKSIRTQLNRKDRQKSIQQSDRAEISKLNSESDNVTEYDNKIKMLAKYRF